MKKIIVCMLCVIVFGFMLPVRLMAQEGAKVDPEAVFHLMQYVKMRADQMHWPSPMRPTSFFGWSGVGDFTKVLQMAGWRHLKNGDIDTRLLVSLPSEKITMDNFLDHAESFLSALTFFYDECVAMRTRGELRDEISVVIPEGEDKIFFQKLKVLSQDLFSGLEESFRMSNPRFVGIAQGVGFFHNEKVLQYVAALYGDDGMKDYFVAVELPFDALKSLDSDALETSVRRALEKILEFVRNHTKPAERPFFLFSQPPAMPSLGQYFWRRLI